MPKAPTICKASPCGRPASYRGHCPAHAAQAERQRGTRQQRGYDAAHDRLRAHHAPRVAAGTITCWRCGQPISPTEPWDLGHDDHNRTQHRGPEHAGTCNRSAGGRASRGGG